MKENRERIKDDFQRHVKDHSMEVLQDNGLYRHLKFSANGSQVYRFDIITWPGYLVVAGDMGEFVFSRIPDMLQFFRGDNGEINPGYWGEKCLAADRHRGIEEFSEEKARKNVREILESHYDGDQEKLNEALKKADFDIDYYDGDVRFYDSCADFETPEGELIFDPAEMPNCREYTYGYIWVLYAIVWGINLYDAKCLVMGPAPSAKGSEA